MHPIKKFLLQLILGDTSYYVIHQNEKKQPLYTDNGTPLEYTFEKEPLKKQQDKR